MNRRFLLSAIAMCILAIGVAALQAGGPMPGQSKAFGKSLGSWMELYWTWFLGGDQPGQVKSVVFLPLPEEGELDVTLGKGEKFVLPMFVYIGETYLPELEIPDDDPAFIPDEFFTDANVLIMLDGEPIIDSEVDDLNEYFFGPEYFDEPIEYAAPTWYGADSAIWVKGIGFVHNPLPPGEHTLTLYITDNFGFGIEFFNTWYITVE